MIEPFLTFYTPTYRRPQQLARCLESVRTQTAVDDIEQIVIPDHVGVGIGGMFARVKEYTHAVHGRYVHLLADDDVLASPTVVAEVRAFASMHRNPDVIIVSTVKNGSLWPCGKPWPPRMGWIDLGCIITRADIWTRYAHEYGHRYEGDWDMMNALHRDGHKAVQSDLVFSIGAVSKGAAEAAA